MIRTRKFHTVIAFLLILGSTYFFRARFLPENIFFALRLLLIVIMVLYAVPKLFTAKQSHFVFPLYLIIASVVISIIPAGYSWDQSIIDSLLATSPYLFYLVFFYLLRSEIKISSIEKFIVIFGVLYIVLFLYQLYLPNRVLFGYQDEFNDFRFGIVRIVFPATGLFILMFFYALTLFSINRNMIWLVLLLIGSVLIIVQATRQMIIAVFLIMTYHFIRKKRNAISMILIFGTLLLFVAETDIINKSYFDAITQKTKMNLSEGERYARVISANFFINEFSPNLLSKVFGNGVPRIGKSKYGQYYQSLNNNDIYFSDVGLIGVYGMFGVFAVIAYLIIFYKSFAVKLTPRYYYLQYYIWYLILTSLTSYSVYHYYFIGSTMLVLYSYQYLLNNRIFVNN